MRRLAIAALAAALAACAGPDSAATSGSRSPGLPSEPELVLRDGANPVPSRWSGTLGGELRTTEPWYEAARGEARREEPGMWLDARDLRDAFTVAGPAGVDVGGPAVPGLAEPGLAEPGLAEPGLAEPGLAEPGLVEPGPPPRAPLPLDGGVLGRGRPWRQALDEDLAALYGDAPELPSPFAGLEAPAAERPTGAELLPRVRTFERLRLTAPTRRSPVRVGLATCDGR